MIQIEAVEIREFRGIRELKIEPHRKSFVVSGPNGSGKSGVVDAIEFGLTGEISRLAGEGTAGITVLRHGPHVDRRDDPAVAEVVLTLYEPEIKKKAVLTRNVKTAKTYSLIPDQPGIRAAIEETARHPELILSRREIIKYIIVEAGERSREIQALLKLDEIGNIRSVLGTVKNRLSATHTNAGRGVTDANDALRRHLDIRALSAQSILDAVNPHRKILGLAEIKELKTDTGVNAGVSEGVTEQAFNKQSALRDLAALQEAEKGFATLCEDEVGRILGDLTAIEDDPNLLEAIKRRSFVERGLALVDGSRCPLCDKEWEDVEHLRQHLRDKLSRLEQAEKLQKRLLDDGVTVASEANGVLGVIRSVRGLAKKESQKEFESELSTWFDHLTALANSMDRVEHMLEKKNIFEKGWINAPASLKGHLEALAEIIKAKPDQSASVAAHTFLTLAEDRLKQCRSAQRLEKEAAEAEEAGKVVYTTYCDVSENYLSKLYEAVEGDFSTYYREINSDDEGEFKAKFEPSEGKLDLEVDFYGRGMFPPGAYHSEGHQDGMGVCLYLALMKRLLGNRFQFVVLDDVVMSVDKDHRKQFCKLLKARFPDTQFIITTHDKIWTKQMQTEGLIQPRAGVAFYSWSVKTGPIHEEVSEVWEQIDGDLDKNDVSNAAGRLRRHLEYVAGELADQLCARPPYRGDFSYDLGDLLPAVIGRQGELLKLAHKSANDWEDNEGKSKVEKMLKARSEALAKYDGESWVINKAIHFNEWADFSKSEFKDVVDAFKALLLQFRCPKPECDSWLYVTPQKGNPEVLRCHCMGINLNLKGR